MDNPVTEARFRAAFADRALVTARAAAALLGVDEKTLATMVQRRQVRAVLVSRVRRFSEADLRAFLASGEGAPEPARLGPRFSEISALAAPRVRRAQPAQRKPAE